jgi:hypothetical protein
MAPTSRVALPGMRKTAEILLPRHQLAVLQRRQPRRPKLNRADQALMATLLSVIPKARRHGLRLLATPETILRWHRDTVRRHRGARPMRGKTGRPATRRNVQALAHRPARENPGRGHRRIHGEQADPGEQAHRVKFMIRDHGPDFTAAFDAVLADAGIRTVPCNVRTPRMNAIAERRTGGRRRELLDRTLAWNQAHPRQILRAYETHHNQHRPHRSPNAAAPLTPLPEPVDLDRYRVQRQTRTACLINEYHLVA